MAPHRAPHFIADSRKAQLVKSRKNEDRFVDQGSLEALEAGSELRARLNRLVGNAAISK
jgi:hypothetical protein